MSDSAATLELRHSSLADDATPSPTTLSEGEEGVFVAIDDPPPVRTVLTVVQGDERRPLEVVSVVEVAERDERSTRGFYGRWVDGEALERAAKVGTEHLEDGTPVVQPVIRDDSAEMNGSDAPAMAMPAPVMIVEDDTGVVDLGDDPYGSEDADETNTATVADDAAADDEAADDAAADDEAADDEAADDETESDAAAQSDGDTDGEASAESSSDDSAAEQETSEATPSASGSDDDASDGSSGGKRKGGRKKRGRRRR